VSAGDVNKQPKELSDLQSKYQSDVQDAIKPIRDRYIDDLKDLLKLELNKGDVDAAATVKKEIKKMEAEAPFFGKWTSNSYGVSIIQFKSQGLFVDDYIGHAHSEGHWKLDTDTGGAVVTYSYGTIRHFQINAAGHLIRDIDSLDYERTDDK
jgi:hypothetical protein